MADSFRQVIEVALQSTTDPKIRELLTQLRDLGSTGDTTDAALSAVVDELNQLSDASRRAAVAADISEALEETGHRLKQAESGLAALNGEYDRFDTKSKAINKAFKDAEAAVTSLTNEQQKLQAALAETSADLGKAGVNTENLADEQQRLRVAIDASAEKIRERIAAAKAAEAAEDQWRASIKDAAAVLQRQETANKTAAEALEKYRTKSKQAAAAQDDLANSANRSVGLLNGLKSALAGLTAFFGVREAIEGTKNILGLGDAAERTRTQLAGLYGSQADGERAFTRLKDVARENGLEFTNTLEAAKKLKAFGLEPLDGTLQSLIDQNARLGGTQETLEGMILAVGQAWSKQKLQGEEILQLVERGVPVWDLLSKATGKNVQELQKLSESGKLGREAIAALVAEIGKASSGAAAANLDTLSGRVQALRDRIQQFFTEVANSGALQFFKDRIAALSADIDRLSANGKLREFAQQLSDSIVAAGKAIEGSIRFVVEYSKQITALAQAYIVLKAAQAGAGIVSAITAMGAATSAAAAPVATFAASIKNLGVMGTLVAGARALAAGIVSLTAAFSGFAVAAAAVVGVKAGQALSDLWDRLTPSVKNAQKAVDEGAASLLMMGEQARLAALRLLQFEQRQTLAAEQVVALSEAERKAYDEGQRGLEQYLVARAKYLISLEGTNRASAAQLDELAEVRARLELVRQGYEAVAAATAKAAEEARRAVETGLSESVLDLVDKLEAARGKADGLGAAFKTIFEEISKTPSADKIADLVIALDAVGGASERAGAQVRDALRAELEKLNGTDLSKFQGAAEFAFDEAGKSASESAEVMRTILGVALEEIGVEAADAGVKVTESGKQILAAFNAIATNSQATSEQVIAAFEAAVSKLSTPEELIQLEGAFRRAFETGKIGADEFGLALGQLKSRMAAVRDEIDPLESAFRQLGITSQQSLDAAADAARRSFEAIRDGAAQGKASAEDVRRAFEAYARAQLAAVADADAWKQAQVIAHLAVQGAAVLSREKLEALGLVTAEAAEKTDALTAAADRFADAAERQAEAADRVADATENQVRTQERSNQAIVIGTQLTERAIEALDRYAGQINRLSRDLMNQQEEARRHIELLDMQIARYDENAQAIQRLRGQYDLLDDSTLQEIAQREQRLRQEQERLAREQQEADRRVREAVERTSNGGSSGGSSAGGGSAPAPNIVNNFNITPTGLLPGITGTGSDFWDQVARKVSREQERLGILRR